MDTRILNTIIYRDKVFRKLEDKDKFIVLFLLTNEFLECIPIVEIGLDLLAFNCSTNEQYMKKLLPKLEYFEIFYIDGFLMIGDKFTYSNYKGGKTAKKKIKLIEDLPIHIRRYIDAEDNIGQLLVNDCSIIEHINHKSETINHKSETINSEKKSEKIEVVSKENLTLVKIVAFYNQVFGKNITETTGFEENFMYWIQRHPEEKIGKAIVNARKDKFWKDKMSLQILFRKKNPRGERVDYIEDLANRGDESVNGGNIAFN